MSRSNWAERARKESGLSPEECAAAIKCSRPTYLNREKFPGTFTIDEIRKLSTIYSDAAKKIAHEALSEVC